MIPIYIPNFVIDVTEEELNSVPWQELTEARQECFMAFGDIRYTYGVGRGERTYKSIPLMVWVNDIMYKLNSEFDCKYNICFLNQYKDEHQHLGYHADNSPSMDHNHPIAVVSFGQPREIWFRLNGHKGPLPSAQKQLLEDGSLFIMPAGFQKEYQHRIPKGGYKMKERSSLTFRRYLE